MTKQAPGLRGAIHRQVWQRLPRNFRRHALYRASLLAAPRPTLDAPPAVPIIVAGAFGAASGLGQSARLCHDALKSAGLSVFGIDLTDALMQPRDASEFLFTPGGHLAGAGTLIVHVNAPLMPLALWNLGANVVHGKRIVGYWAWELSEVAPDWPHGVPFVHDIWVPSRFTAAAIALISGGRSVHVVPHPVAVGALPVQRRARTNGQPFTVLTMFDMASSFARKNPLAAIAAFRTAFGDDPDARLIVKANNVTSFRDGRRQLHSAAGAAKNISIIEAAITTAELAALIDNSDALISLHRSEGFGLPLAEAMLRGVPVVATDWSGNTDFVTTETGLPIPYGLIPAADPQATYHFPTQRWADADVPAAALALQRLRNDQGLADRLSFAAAAFAQRAWSANAYAQIARVLLRV